jgi:hypothetical protein
MSPFGWILLGLGFCIVAGTVGAGFVAYRIASGVRQEIGRVSREFGAAPEIAAVRMAARLASPDELIAMDPPRGLALLSELDGTDGPSAILKAMTAPFPTERALRVDEPSGVNSQWDVDAGGSPAVDVRSGDRGFSLQLSGTDEGGWLSIDTDEGRVRLEVDGTDGAGRIRILTDDARAEATFGDHAERAPAWLEQQATIPDGYRPVLSITSDRGLLGAVAWEADDAPSTLLSALANALEEDGYEVEAEHVAVDATGEHGSLWGRHAGEGRMVFAIAHRDRLGDTGLLVGYGEKR